MKNTTPEHGAPAPPNIGRIAATFQNLETRAKMQFVAEDYEQMAERAEMREQEATEQAKGQPGTARPSRVERPA